MNCNTIISLVAFAAIFLAAVFLFIRNYPSDRWFSVVFIVAGGVLAWNTEAETEAEAEAEAEAEYKIDCFNNKPADTINTTNEHDDGSNARQEQEGTEGGGERMGDDEGK
jgi:hypothetical protein